jgi:GWxTD domain-containing protein
MEDLKYLITEDEYDNYNQAVSDSARIAFIEQFWLKRNPLPAAPWNVRLVEHYQRLNYADKNYEYDGFRTWFADPDALGYLEYPVTRKLNNEYNDKGIIYIRHGPPNETARTSGFEVETNESWLYYANPPNIEMTFHFISGKSGNDWRFSPIITDPAMLQDRLTWGNIYHFLMNADPLEKLQYQEEMALQSRKSVSDGLSTDRHTWPEGIETFNFPISIETFRGDTGFSRIDIAYSIPAIPEISKNLVISDDSLIHIENGLAILNHTYDAVIKELSVELVDQFDTLERIETYSYLLHPDTYTVAIHLDPKDFNILGGYKFKFGVTDYSGDDLVMSDIQLADLIEPVSDSSAFIKEGLSVWPNPAHQFNRNLPIYLYFEIYNLRLDDQGISQFSIDYNLSHTNPEPRGISNFFGLFGNKEKSSITIRNEHQAGADFSTEYLALDISQMQAGEYELEITVLDELSKASTTNKVQLTLE